MSSNPFICILIFLKCLFLGTACQSQTQIPKILFFEDFEGEKPFSNAYGVERGNWDYALNYVTDPVFKGSKAVRFEIREGQDLVQNGVRSEATIIKGIPNREMWYSFAVYFPSDGFNKDSQREVISQWYQNGTPATSFRGRNDRLLLDTGNLPEKREPYDLGPITKDKWTEVIFHFIHSYESDGLVEVWINGFKVLTKSGGNIYKGILPKWKLGLYKSSFQFHNSDVNHRFIYFDNIKVGGPTASLEDMTPGN